MKDEKREKMKACRRVRNSKFLFAISAATLMAAGTCAIAKVAPRGLAGRGRAGQPAARTRGIYADVEAYVPGEVLVLLSADVERKGVRGADEDFAGAEAAVRGKIVRRMALSRRQRVLRVKLPLGKSVKAAIAENWRARDRRILVVEPNYRVRIAGVPDDPLFAQMWGLNNTGQTGGAEDADIDAPEAWDLAAGVPETSDVIVAIIDTVSTICTRIWLRMCGSIPERLAATISTTTGMDMSTMCMAMISSRPIVTPATLTGMGHTVQGQSEPSAITSLE